ncbi:MAG TPA: lipoyl synthase [Lentisphaeria bacterium]|nr:MAG: lipoyl synthase [Lentisphaerae bacterium GWF2_50_93]HCE42917.1 lipoyl synthase [Lentisphaeria bacterium]
MNNPINKVRPKLPPWIRVKASGGDGRAKVESLISQYNLHTVCQSAKCPNLCECWHKQTATFMILGNECTRNCTFCAVSHSRKPSAPDKDEPAKIAEAAKKMKLKYVVVTSVTRDDLPDGGASLFAETIRALKEKIPSVKVEVLTPDFGGDIGCIKRVVDAGPDVFNHNLETVERLAGEIRSGADFRRSLKVLKAAFELGQSKLSVKSGIMVGLGETDQEIEETIREIRRTGAEMLTIGQYLPPSSSHRPLDRYVTPETFEKWRDFAQGLGFRSVASGPLVRSSYNAENFYL